VTNVLEVSDLSVHFPTERGTVRAVDGVSFHVAEGETLGLVGESGCGKSVLALSLLRLPPPPGRITGGRIVFQGTDLMALPEKRLRHFRGRGIGLVFQEPSAALDPVFTVGAQIAEGPIVHKMMTRKEARAEAVRLMEVVRIPDAGRRVHDYPHQMSGGMRQRVMIAIALACRPALLVADEPTTALDVTIQAEILDLLRQLKDEYRLSLLLISHNLGVVAETADRVAVMYAARIVEEAPVRDLFAAAKHPYTEGLLRSVPRLGEPGRSGDGGRRRLPSIEGSVPDLARLPGGCSFHPRCPDVMPECRTRDLRLRPLPGAGGRAAAGGGPPARQVACFKFHDPDGRPR
jgi:oligopeptide/dipeptide ABC transporter ATP-binding protein